MWHNPQSSPRGMRAWLARSWRRSRLGGSKSSSIPRALAGFATRQGPLPTRTCCACKWHSADGPARNDLIRRVQSRRTRPHPWRRDHARNHGGSEDEDFRSSAGELHHGGARQYPTSQPVLSRRRRSRRQKLGGVSIAVESKQLQVISSPTRNRSAMVAFSVPLCRRGRASAALSSLPPFLSTKHCPIDGCEWEDR